MATMQVLPTEAHAARIAPAEIRVRAHVSAHDETLLHAAFVTIVRRGLHNVCAYWRCIFYILMIYFLVHSGCAGVSMEIFIMQTEMPATA